MEEKFSQVLSLRFLCRSLLYEKELMPSSLELNL